LRVALTPFSLCLANTSTVLVAYAAELINLSFVERLFTLIEHQPVSFGNIQTIITGRALLLFAQLSIGFALSFMSNER